MPSGVLDDRYFQWLYSLVADVKIRRGPHTHWNLLYKLFSMEFAWFVPNDDNRAEDGRELRNEWALIEGTHIDAEWASRGCSFLEMLIGLSRRLEFQTDHDVVFWFWRLLGNVGLSNYHDRHHFDEEDVEDRIFVVIWRNYDRNGCGGLFPLENATRDQRKVEIWRQMNDYLLQGWQGG